jgi:hypothetical protein
MHEHAERGRQHLSFIVSIKKPGIVKRMMMLGG